MTFDLLNILNQPNKQPLGLRVNSLHTSQLAWGGLAELGKGRGDPETPETTHTHTRAATPMFTVMLSTLITPDPPNEEGWEHAAPPAGRREGMTHKDLRRGRDTPLQRAAPPPPPVGAGGPGTSGVRPSREAGFFTQWEQWKQWEQRMGRDKGEKL